MAQQFRRYLAKRLVYVALTIFLILTFNFVIFRVMPGDPTRIVIPKGVAPGSQTFELLKHHYGLDQPKVVQYVVYLNQLIHGEFGTSMSFEPNVPVQDILGPFVLNTFILAGSGTVISIMIGLWFGRQAAWKRGQPVDKVGSAFFLVFYCMPTFLFALIMLTITKMYVPEWPLSGAYSTTYHSMDFASQIGDRVVHTLLPLAALVVETIATFSIITRSSLIDVMTEEYMVTAVAKGLPSRDILHKHAMPNAMLPVVTVVAMNIGWILSGSIMIEIVFTYQGLGYLTYKAVFDQDYPLLQAAFMLEAVAVVIANFLADCTLFYLDPRVKI
jgi:peptide/nickel transport system permease protein